MSFEDLSLSAPLLASVRAAGYTEPTPIQRQAIPHILQGRDVLGIAQTGTGKTAAFALPILQRLGAPPASGPRHVRCLVLSPTRELAAQIGDSFATYGSNTRLRHAVIFGGVGQGNQEKALRDGIDVLVATPGRLLDLMGQGFARFDKLEVFVLDEADRMLDMGFIHDVRRVVAAIPKKRQTLFFSATMPDEVSSLANALLIEPVRVEVTPVATTAEKVDQSVFFVEKNDKRALLEHLLRDQKVERALVFTRTKHGANRVAEQLTRANIAALAIHGNKSQNARERALGGFKTGTTRVLVATDIAARGIDVEGITHVINFDLPNVPESYVHRIGRTARAGADGVAWSFCDAEERAYLRDIERTIRMRVPVAGEHPFRSTVPMDARVSPPSGNGHGGGQRGGQHRGGGGGGGGAHRGGGAGGGGGGGHRGGGQRSGQGGGQRSGQGGGQRPAQHGAGHGGQAGSHAPRSNNGGHGGGARPAQPHGGGHTSHGGRAAPQRNTTRH